MPLTLPDASRSMRDMAARETSNWIVVWKGTKTRISVAPGVALVSHLLTSVLLPDDL